MERDAVFGEYVDALSHAVDAETLTSLAKMAGSDYRLTAPAKEALMKRVRELRMLFEQNAKLRDSFESTSGIEPAAGGEGRGKALSGDASRIPSNQLSTPEAAGEPVLSVIPPVDPEALAAHIKRWNALAKVIEENVNGALVKIPTKQGLRPYRARPFYNEIRVLGNIAVSPPLRKTSDSKEGIAEIDLEVYPRTNPSRRVFGMGRADRSEKGKADFTINQLLGLAWTRASNRATRELAGYGEPSLEEVE